MKFFMITLMALSICNAKVYAQAIDPDSVLVAKVCEQSFTIKVSKKKENYFLQLGEQKKVKVSSDILRDSVLSKYRTKIEEGIAKSCKKIGIDDQAIFSETVDLAIKKIGNKFFPPSMSLYPVTIDTLVIDDSHYFAMIKTTSNGFILSAITISEEGEIKNQDIINWDSTGKLLSFPKTVLVAPFLQNFNDFVKLQQKNAKIKTPAYYILCTDISPLTYELVYSDIPGTGVKTGIVISPESAIKLADPSLTQLKIDDNSQNVQPFKGAEKTVSPNPISKKGAVISHQQIPYCGDNSFNISTSIYLPSSQDSVVVILKYQGQPEIDTIMPIDFTSGELKYLVLKTANPKVCWDSQLEEMLYDFLSNNTKKYAPIIETLNTNSNAKNTAATNAAIPTLKKDSILQSPKTDTTAKSQSNKTDSIAKYDMLNNITLLNAFNFDFTGKLTSSYLGLFNIFAPDFGYHKNKKGEWRRYWGGFAGIEKINYGNANINGGDSSQVQYLYQYVLKNPISYNSYNRAVDSGATYYYQYNKYTLSTKNTSWSFYFDPTYRLPLLKYHEKDPKVGIYAHLHLELLVNKFSGSINMQTISYDSGIYRSPSSPNPMNNYLPSQYTNNSTIITGNFGAGIMMYLAPFSDTLSYFYFQATGGISVNSPNLYAITTLSSKTDSGRTIISLPSINSEQVNQTIIYPHNRFFYMFRAIFMQALSNKTQLIIGMSVRGILPAKTSQYAAYVGLNLDLSILSTLFGSK